MRYRINLMTGLIGLALLAAPITAAAKDDKDNAPQARAQAHHDASHSERAPAHFNAPAHNNAPAMAPRHEQGANRNINAAPATATRNNFREQRADRTVRAAPAVETRSDFRQDRREARRTDRREDRNDHDGWRSDHPNYDYDNDRHWGPYYTGGPYYLMPQGYAGGACAWARHLRAVYVHDRYTGHPAAAADLLPRLHRAERACGVNYGYNGYRYYR